MAKSPVEIPSDTIAPGAAPMSGNGHVTKTPAIPLAIKKLLLSHSRDELIRRLSPERKSVYERIQGLRQAIGDSPIDVTETLRELREHD